MSTTIKPSYAGVVALTVTNLQSLGSDNNLLAGWSSAGRDNTSDLWDDAEVSGVLVTGTSPTGSDWIEIWVWTAIDDTPTYPDTITGSEATKTLTSSNVKNSGCFRQGWAITVDATTNRSYPFSFNVAPLFGGKMPKKAWGVFIVHNTQVALKSSGQVVNITGFNYQNV
jgi:hypothetical protein